MVTYSDAFLDDLAEYVGADLVEMEAYTKVLWADGLISSFARHLDLPGKRYLDAGCGHGALAMSAHNHGLDVEMFDFMPRAVELAGRRFKDLSIPAKAFAHDLRAPIPNGLHEAFDIVTNIQVLEHLPREDQLQAIRNLCGMVRPGGFLFIDTENSLYPYDRHDTFLPLVRLLAPPVAEALVTKLGLALNHVEPSFGHAVALHDYLSYDFLVGAAAILGLDVVDKASPYADMRGKLFALTGGNWLHDNVARHFEAERFLPIAVLLQKRANGA